MRRRSLVNVLAGLLLAGIGPAAQGTDLVTPGATLERLATGFGFVEGPAADSEGGLYFSDIPSDRIHHWTPETGVTTVREQTGRANGLRFDAEGNLLVCEMDGRRITSIDQHGAVSILADELDGHQFNSPNDLWVAPNGGIYFSDPWYGPDGDLEMGGEHVYYISPDRQEVRQVTDDLVRPTGIIGTADGTHLYIADQGAGRTYVYTPAERYADQQTAVRQPRLRWYDDGRARQCLCDRTGHHGLQPARRADRVDRCARTARESHVWRSRSDDLFHHGADVHLRARDGHHRAVTETDRMMPPTGTSEG